MSDIIFTLAQFIFILWPLFIVTALVYSFQGHLAWRALVHRIRQSLFVTWVVLLIDWVITLFAPLPTPGLIPEPWNTLLFFAGFALLLIAEASRLGLLRNRLLAHVHLRRTRSLTELKAMDPYAFENLVSETYRSLGFQARHVGHSGDHGVDVELTTSQGERWIVQCKRYHGTVGESIIRDLYGTMVSEKARRAILVTTAHITPPAATWAQGKPIELIDGLALLKLMDEAHRRTQGTLLNRLATWLEGWLAPLAPASSTERSSYGRSASEGAVGLSSVRARPAAPAASTERSSAGPEARPAAPAGLQNREETEASIGYASGNALGATQPVRRPAAPTHPVNIHPAHFSPAVHHAGNNHNVAPLCPIHRVSMVPMPARASDRPGRILYRCRNYPNCRVVLEPEKMK